MTEALQTPGANVILGMASSSEPMHARTGHSAAQGTQSGPNAPSVPPHGPDVETFIVDMMTYGGMTREQAVAELAKDGIIAPAAPEAPDAVDAYLQSIGLPPAKPSEYVLPPLGQSSAAETAQVDSMVRGWFATAKLPAGVGNYIAAEADRFAAAWARMSPAERELAERTSTAQLQRVLGDRYEEALSRARDLIHEVDAKHGGKLIPYLERSGVLNHTGIVMQIVMHADRLASRPRQ